MRTQVIIEDHVLPQLLTSAIEAYEFSHRAHARGKANKGLETFGLLWGYGLPARNGLWKHASGMSSCASEAKAARMM